METSFKDICYISFVLTLWDQDKSSTILQCFIIFQILLKFVTKAPMNKKLASDQIMLIQASGKYLNQWWLIYRGIYMYASFGHIDLSIHWIKKV